MPSLKSTSTVVRLAEAIEFSEFLTVMLKELVSVVANLASVIVSCAGLGVVSVLWNAYP